MPLELTHCHIEAVYECLRAFDPFKQLPPAESVEFVVSKHRDRVGDHRHSGIDHRITISCHWIGTLDALMRVTAHEMIHMLQYERGIRRTHGAEFQRLARIICGQTGWNLKEF